MPWAAVLRASEGRTELEDGEVPPSGREPAGSGPCDWLALPCPQVYKGYVDDLRNTDNAWIETVAVSVHFPDQSDELKRLNSVRGSGARLWAGHLGRTGV